MLGPSAFQKNASDGARMKKPSTNKPGARSQTSLPWSSTLRLAAPLALYRVGMLLLVKLGIMMLPMAFSRVSTEQVDGRHVSYLEACWTWDSYNYWLISQFGYAGRAGLNHFFPLWPGCLSLISLVAGHTFVTGLVLVNVISIASLLVLHRYAALRIGEAAAHATLLIYICSPVAFFFGVPYSESLFLLLVAAMFLGLEIECGWLVWIAGFLAVFTRAVGFLCILPVLVDQLRKGNRPRAIKLASGPAIGLIAYFIVMRVLGGEALGAVTEQDDFFGSSASRLLHPLQFAQRFCTFTLPNDGFHFLPIDRCMFLVCLAALFWIARNSLAELAFAAPLLIIPALSNNLMSFSRYALVVIPVYLAYGKLLSNPPRRPWLAAICLISFGLQMLLLFEHTHGIWVG
jgi:hypothetical protein